MALHNAAAAQAETRLGDLNSQYVMDIASLNDHVKLSIVDRKVNEQVILERDEHIKALKDSIAMSLEFDTEDVE
eukprot:7655619-Heterocapsa_arctica.AAC.1